MASKSDERKTACLCFLSTSMLCLTIANGSSGVTGFWFILPRQGNCAYYCDDVRESGVKVTDIVTMLRLNAVVPRLPVKLR